MAEKRLQEKIEEAKSLINSYNDLINLVEKVGGIKLRILTVTHDNIGKVRGILRELRVECDRAIGTLEEKISYIPLAEKIKLEPLKEELSKISAEIKNVYLEKNIKNAINEIEVGHNLSAWLIAGRVIRYILQNIPGKTLDEKITFLKKKM